MPDLTGMSGHRDAHLFHQSAVDNAARWHTHAAESLSIAATAVIAIHPDWQFLSAPDPLGRACGVSLMIDTALIFSGWLRWYHFPFELMRFTTHQRNLFAIGISHDDIIDPRLATL